MHNRVAGRFLWKDEWGLPQYRVGFRGRAYGNQKYLVDPRSILVAVAEALLPVNVGSWNLIKADPSGNGTSLTQSSVASR